MRLSSVRLKPDRHRRTMRWASWALVTITFGLVACASAGGGAAGHKSACGLRASDSAFAATGPVFRDCAVDTKAQALSSSSGIDFQPRRGGPTCYSAEVEFVVNATGYPESNTAHVVRANDQGFADAVLAAVRTWRYQPAMKDGKPVRQIVDERRMAQTAVVAAPAGAPVASRPPTNLPPPNC